MPKRVVISGLLLIVAVGYGQEWIARYQGPYGEDYARAIAVDNLKNVYLTGASQGSGAGFINDFATVKYDSLGLEQWVARYNGSPTQNWPDEARAIAVDAHGVCVTGYISYYILDDSCDYCTVKYDQETGDTLWMRTYDGPVGTCDQAYAIAMDGDGNVYVTGKSEGTGTNFDFLTIKYHSDGVEQWTARYNNPAGNGWDIAYALAVDSSGNVYVTGESYDPSTYYDCVTVKYDSLGVQQWAQRYSYEGNWSDEGQAITVDDTGNVYVTGRSVSTTTSWDYATMKYSTSGIQQWATRYHGMSNYDDEPTGIALDDSGNVYVTGKSGIDQLFRYQFATVKYTPNGTQEWVKTYIGPANLSANANAVVIDHQNSICVTGLDYGADTTAEYVTIKYSPNGTEEWIARYSAGVVQGDDWATAVCVDQYNYIYVTGCSESSDGNPDYLTIKYSPSGPGIEEHETCRPQSNTSLLQVWPNPFRTNCRIALYGSGVCEDMSALRIYDVTGRLVRSFSPRPVISWNGTDNSDKTVPAGVYFVKLESNNCRPVVKVILLE
ncbi:hypothetical protein AMJ74_03180 [candidate division WOR_3 bacterium SM1_77]|uniref:Secretion system C-terminal sorting domain-containing protein n=2 Tax=Bacteria division WOR-3 TaxID=1703755 RepID=A0A0S8JXP2_UNCW3|nr:MAG: hypothetical protein AMJ74_03180 [candidate division WOR_3 bacterium SM1_77]